MSCSICLDTFRNPKILPCLHTFCRKCLENHAKYKPLSRQANKLKCPLCRYEMCIPPSGLNTLFTNYFVGDKRFSPENICEDCNKYKTYTCCHLCDDFLCIDCQRNHQCEFKCTTSELVLSESDEDDETDFTRLLSILSIESSSSSTKIEANVVNKFSVSSDLDSTSRATSILPLHGDGALVVVDHGPDVIRFDKHCKRRDTIQVGEGIRDIAYGPNGRIFLLQDTTHSIIELCGKNVQLFANLPCTRPLDMSFFSDGQSVVVAIEDALERYKEGERIEEQIKLSILIFLRSDGSILRVETETVFTMSRVAIIPNLNCTCLLNSRNGCIYFILSDGTLLGKYGIRNEFSPLSLLENLNFVPMGLCCYGEENIIAYNHDSSFLHLVDSLGRLIAVIDTTSPLGLGSPGTIKVAPNDELWVGDSKSSTIRILKITRYKNFFPE